MYTLYVSSSPIKASWPLFLSYSQLHTYTHTYFKDEEGKTQGTEQQRNTVSLSLPPPVCAFFTQAAHMGDLVLLKACHLSPPLCINPDPCFCKWRKLRLKVRASQLWSPCRNPYPNLNNWSKHRVKTSQHWDAYERCNSTPNRARVSASPGGDDLAGEAKVLSSHFVEKL